MKYEFKKIAEDEYELKYVDVKDEEKVINFKCTVNIATKLQSVVSKARMKMYAELAKAGMTKNDFIVERKGKDGKTIYDESNFIAYEETFKNEVTSEIIDDLFKECFEMGIAEFFMNIKVPTDEKKMESEVQLFTTKFMSILIGKEFSEEAMEIPSEKEKQQDNI